MPVDIDVLNNQVQQMQQGVTDYLQWAKQGIPTVTSLVTWSQNTQPFIKAHDDAIKQLKGSLDALTNRVNQLAGDVQQLQAAVAALEAG
jgi:flagellar biosynthesis chaperone FliJ